MKRLAKGPQKIGTILSQVLEAKGLDKRIEEHKALIIWDKVVGKTISLHTMPGWIKNGILWVFVSDSIWQQELTFLEAQIVEKINQEVAPLGAGQGGKIRRIRFIQKGAR